MENTRRQQIAADTLVAAAVLALGAVLVVAGRTLSGGVAPGTSGDWFRIDPTAFDAAQQLSVDVLLGIVATLVGLVVVAWWLLSAAIAITSALLVAAGARRAADRTGAFAPTFMRRLALALLGIGLVATPAAHAQELPDPAWQPSAPTSVLSAAAPSSAAGSPEVSAGGYSTTPAPQPPSGPLAPSPAPSLVPSSAPALPSPTGAGSPGGAPEAGSGAQPTARGVSVPQAAWVPSALPADPGPLVRQPTRMAAASGPIEVRPGDTLWSIVARHLGPGASDLQIAEAWPAWYHANAGFIGDDPNLIHPGVLLMPPG